MLTIYSSFERRERMSVWKSTAAPVTNTIYTTNDCVLLQKCDLNILI